MNNRKSLKDLNLLDRFLFAEAMEDPEIARTMLEIILGKDLVLKYLPQTEKEIRANPAKRFVKLDVWMMDSDNVVYDAEVQKKNTQNLPKRSRYYQSLIDEKLLEPGITDFNELNPVCIILIAPFDLGGEELYRYTYQMTCDEVPGLPLGDGGIRIFLNTHGKHPELVSPELVELLTYIENTREEVSEQCTSQRIKEMHRRVEKIRASEEVRAKYMQEWEERALERQEAEARGREEGERIGEARGEARGRKEGEAIGAARLSRLCSMLISEQKQEELNLVLTDEAYREEKYQEYGIS